MRILYNLVLALYVILNSIEISSGMQPETRDFLTNFGKSNEHANHQELRSKFDCLPNGDHIPGAARCGPSYSPGRHSPERTLPLARHHSSARTLPPAEPPLRARSRSPHARSKSPRSRGRSLTILGFKVEELRFIRFISNMNQNRIFELRKYAFPPDKPIRLRTKDHHLGPMPIEEKIVLSTSNGDVYAILEQLQKSTVFRGIYTTGTLSGKRAKINIHSGLIEELTPEEIAACPLSNQNPILKNFTLVRV